MTETILELNRAIWDIQRWDKIEKIRRRQRASNHIANPMVRTRIFARDNYHCIICGRRDNLTIDHIVSVLRGGSDEDNNLQTLCKYCNSTKAP